MIADDFIHKSFYRSEYFGTFDKYFDLVWNKNNKCTKQALTARVDKDLEFERRTTYAWVKMLF